MSHYDVDIFCKNCKCYLGTVYGGYDEDRICDDCQRKEHHKSDTPLEWFIRNLPR